MSTFSKIYNGWLDIFTINYFHLLTRSRLKKIGPLVKGEILDIGCGKKPYKNNFQNCTVYRGTNSSSYYKVAGIPNETDLIVDDGCNLPLPDSSVDNILNFQVLPVFEDMNQFFGEVKRVIKPGGHFLITSDFMYPLWNAPFNFWRTTAFGLEKLAKQNGFEIITVNDFGGFWNMLARVFPRYLRGQLFNFIISFRNEKNSIKKIVKGIRVLVWLPLVPLLPFIGNLLIPVFAIMDSLGKDSDFTTNYLMLMRKPK